MSQPAILKMSDDKLGYGAVNSSPIRSDTGSNTSEASVKKKIPWWSYIWVAIFSPNVGSKTDLALGL